MKYYLTGFAVMALAAAPSWSQSSGAGTTTGPATGNPSGGDVGSIDSLSSGANGKPGAFAKDSSVAPATGAGDTATSKHSKKSRSGSKTDAAAASTGQTPSTTPQ